MKTRVCELCNRQATLYCFSDSAFLCSSCDSQVHRANFLVARHLRVTVCSNCKALTGDPVSVAGALCSSCSPASSDSCSDRRKTGRVGMPEFVFENWCEKMGINGDDAVRIARCACRVCLDEMTSLPLRVCLAASLWFGLRLTSGFCGTRPLSTWQVLKRVEAVSGVPAKLIVASQSKVERVLKIRKQQRSHLEEGLDECSA